VKTKSLNTQKSAPPSVTAVDARHGHHRPQNKLQNPVLLSDHEKVTIIAPRLPRNPPHIHHDLPPRKQTRNSNIPNQNTIPPQNFFFAQIPPKAVPRTVNFFSQSCIGNPEPSAETKTTMEQEDRSGDVPDCLDFAITSP